MKAAGSGSEASRVTPVGQNPQTQPAWDMPTEHLNRWPPILAILAAIALYVTLPDKLYYGPRWLLPAIEAAMLLALAVVRQVEEEHHWQRRLMIALTGVINAANIGSLLLLIHALLGNGTLHGQAITAQELIFWSAQVWLTNVLVFALWYWELDQGGPVTRCHPHRHPPDLLFPQMVNPDAAPPHWSPSFFDYLYTSFTNATAFSPTDTMPLTSWAKLLFMIQSLASLLTVILVAARAVNILR